MTADIEAGRAINQRGGGVYAGAFRGRSAANANCVNATTAMPPINTVENRCVTGNSPFDCSKIACRSGLLIKRKQTAHEISRSCVNLVTCATQVACPLWVKSRHVQRKMGCPLLLQKRTFSKLGCARFSQALEAREDRL